MAHFFIKNFRLGNIMDTVMISVVIPTYKRPQLLLRCIDTLIHQKFSATNFEIIIVSDGPDEITSTEIIKPREGKTPIRFLSLPKKAGPAAARNLGWKSAAGKFIAFTDDDCIPHENWLASLYDHYNILGSPERAAFRGRTIVPVKERPTDYERNISNLETADFITANCACTRAALEAVGGLDEQFTMAWREDSDLQFRLMEMSIPIYDVPQAIITHPVREAPWGISLREERKGLFNALLFKKYPNLYKEKIQPNPPWRYYVITFLLILFLIGVFSRNSSLTYPALGGWTILTIGFALKRLKGTSRSLRHVSEMLMTSAIIPVLSLYWRIYGCLKYKVLLFP
jgi:glycosyltransferase involved in cell wall biosynthesis